MTHNRTLQAISILHRVVAVIPRASVLRRVPRVGKVVLGSNGALSDSIYTVHVHGLVLPYPVPMYACTIVFEVIYYLDINSLESV